MFIFFFFQAEDGIRDLVRSRGLGDVYKRQRVHRQLQASASTSSQENAGQGLGGPESMSEDAIGVKYLTLGRTGLQAVSYTHLTLPTSDLV